MFDTEGSEKFQARLKRESNGSIPTLAVRLIKYEIDGIAYYLATTLKEEKYPRESFRDLYHERWGAEELYKISKSVMAVEKFHSKTLRGVEQELYANLALITINRVFTNYTDAEPPQKADLRSGSRRVKNRRVTNFTNSLAAVSRNFESLLLVGVVNLCKPVLAILESLYRRRTTIRPNRSYPRRSLEPQSKWQSFRTKVSKATKKRIPPKAA